jgi:ribosomal-protein-alanine N-acetyltransferase
MTAPISGASSAGVDLADGVRLRPLARTDAQAMLDAHLRNREHLRPTEPPRPDTFFSLAGQVERLDLQLRQQEDRRLAGWVLEAGDGRIVGAMTLTNIVLGPLRSGNLGYWVDRDLTGRGLASAAAEVVCRKADEELGLHRVEAGVLLDNVASQRVLVRCGFDLIGTATQLLHINGAWRDHLLYQRILNDRPPS